MSLFPKCTFDVAVPGAVLRAGERTEATLTVDVPEPIERVQGILIEWSSEVWCMVGFGNTRRRVDKELFSFEVRIPLPGGTPLAARAHRFPFTIALPEWLPPSARCVDECGVDHVLRARLDVDWALDPKVEISPTVLGATRRAERKPVTVRSPPELRDDVALELALDSQVIVHGQSLRGSLALRAGRESRFDAVVLRVVERFAFRVDGHSGSATKAHPPVEIDAAALRRGDAVPFDLSISAAAPSFAHATMHHDLQVVVALDVPWGLDPEFAFVIDVMPRGSALAGDVAQAAVGRGALERLAADVATATGLRRGALPILVEVDAGAVSARVADAPRRGRLGVDVDVSFPDLGLGIRFGAPRLFANGARQRMPERLAERYVLSIAERSGAASLDAAALAVFFQTVLAELEGANDIRLSDDRLIAHWAISDPAASPFVEPARLAQRKVGQIARAIAALPFPQGASHVADAWRAAAVELGATLVPASPALHGASIAKRLQTGDERVFPITLVTRWSDGEPQTEALVDLASAPAPAGVGFDAKNPSPHARAAGATFAHAVVRDDGKCAVLEHAGLTADPRELMPAIDAFVSWVLDARGERVTTAPYR